MFKLLLSVYTIGHAASVSWRSERGSLQCPCNTLDFNNVSLSNILEQLYCIVGFIVFIH